MRVAAPISRLDEIEPVIAAGADELYFGAVPEGWAERFGVSAVSRRTFGNLAEGELARAVGTIRERGRHASLALNSQRYPEDRIELALGLAERFAEAGGNAIIVGDPVLLAALAERGLSVRLHVSSIAACRNREAARLCHDLGAARVVFPRYLTLAEIAEIVAAVPELEFEAFVLNDGCLFEEGVCHTVHLPGQLGGPICMDTYALAWGRDDGRALDADEAAALAANDAAYERWAWYKFSCGFTTTEDGYPWGPCGLCALPRFAACGLTTVKLAGRETPTARKLKSLALVRTVLDRMADGAEIMDFAQGLRGRPDHCATGYMCYYPDVLERPASKARAAAG